MRSWFLFVTFALASHSALAGEPRRHGDLVVEDPPRARTEDALGRRFPDIEGSLRIGDPRVWVGAPIPAFVAIGAGDLELASLRPTATGFVALYFEPFALPGGERGCGRGNMWDNCRYLVRHYDEDGKVAWEVEPNVFFERKDHIALHALALSGSTLFLSEACQTYAKDAKGKCSGVLALDVSASPPKRLWRSKYLTTNTDVVPVGNWLVTGYGFTAEKDALYVLRATDGKIMTKAALPKAPERIELRPDGTLAVSIYGETEPRIFELVDGKRPKLRARN